MMKNNTLYLYATLQNTNRERMERKRYPTVSGSLRDLIEYEYDRCGVDLPQGTSEGALNTYSIDVAEFRVTAMGEVPSAAVEQIATSMRKP